MPLELGIRTTGLNDGNIFFEWVLHCIHFLDAVENPENIHPYDLGKHYHSLHIKLKHIESNVGIMD